MSAPYAKYVLMAGNQDGRTTKLRHSMTTGRMLGFSDSEVISGNNALYNANPPNPWYWHIILDEADGASTLAVKTLVRITYDVLFIDRNETTLDFLAARVKESLAAREKRRTTLVEQKHDFVEVKESPLREPATERPTPRALNLLVNLATPGGKAVDRTAACFVGKRNP